MKKRILLAQGVPGWLAELFSADAGAEDDYYAVRALLEKGVSPGVRFGDHILKGELRGWRAFAIGQQQDGQGARVIYFATPTRVNIVAVGSHDAAYTRAKVAKVRARRR